MIETIEDDETENAPAILSYDETFALFSAINQDLKLFTERVEYYNNRHDNSAMESLEFWNERLTRLTRAKEKIQSGVKVNPMFTRIWWNSNIIALL